MREKNEREELECWVEPDHFLDSGHRGPCDELFLQGSWKDQYGRIWVCADLGYFCESERSVFLYDQRSDAFGENRISSQKLEQTDPVSAAASVLECCILSVQYILYGK